MLHRGYHRLTQTALNASSGAVVVKSGLVVPHTVKDHVRILLNARMILYIQAKMLKSYKLVGMDGLDL